MSTSSKDTLSTNIGSPSNYTDASAGQLRDDIQQTRESMSATIDEIGSRLSPQQLATQAKDALTTNAQQLAQTATNRAQTIGADMQAQANQLALATREQAELRGQQLRGWYNAMTDKYPWFPAALLGVALATSALILWRFNARED